MKFWSSRSQEQVSLSSQVADKVKTTTCYMCACRCGIQVYVKEGKLRYIEGNPHHPVNKGVLCAKGSAGIMQHYSPARLQKPLLRIGERGEGRFREIGWDEALSLATTWLADIRARDPSKLAFFTGRDQSQSFTGWWAGRFGTPNFAAHGGFCSVNIAAAGMYTIGGSFWEFGEVDWEHTRYLMMFGVAEDHDSNPIKIGLGSLRSKAQAKIVAINPVRTGYAAIADEWIGIRPGTDGLLILSLIHELLRADKIDGEFLARYTNASWLVIDAPGTARHGLFARDNKGNPLCFDGRYKKIVSALSPEANPLLVGARDLDDGTKVVPVFELIAHRYLDPIYAPEQVAMQTGVPAATIKRLAAELAEVAFSKRVVLNVPWTDWAGRRHQQMIGRPISIHAMRGISAHANGFDTCRGIHVLQMLLGAIDTPGSFRFKPPYPKAAPPGLKPVGQTVASQTAIDGALLGYPTDPADLLIEDNGTAKRIDKAYSWEFPLAAHGLLHMLLHNAWAGDPYPIECLFLYMANMGWNSAMNIGNSIKYLTDKNSDGSYRIPKIIYVDAYNSETVAYADLVLPDTTYLERWDCISLLDRPISCADGPADAIRQPVVTPDRDVRPFQDVLLDLGVRLKLPDMVDEKDQPLYPGGYADYMVNHQRSPGIGPLAGWRGKEGQSVGIGAPNPQQLNRYVENGCHWYQPLTPAQRYFKMGNADYLTYAKQMGWLAKSEPLILQLYVEPMQKFRLAAEGHGTVQPPDLLRGQVRKYFDPLPQWYPPGEITSEDKAYPLHAITQRPMHMYHSWGSQNAWLRQITDRNYLFIHVDCAKAHNLSEGDWVWVISPHGRIKAPIKTMHGVNPDTVWTWNAIGKRKGAWGLSLTAPEANQGFVLNHLIADLLPPREHKTKIANADPITGQAAWYDLKVRLEKCLPCETKEGAPILAPLQSNGTPSEKILRQGANIKDTPINISPPPFKEWIGNSDSYLEQKILQEDRHD
ncbi:MAG: molybdopterin oxidoreductase family protein [Alphaproteobacteria bacterium]